MPLTASIRSLRRTSARWFPLLDAWRQLLQRSGRGTQDRARLELEQLEDYSLPSSSITGSVFGQPSNLGLAARVVYLDLNHDGKLDNVTNTVAATSTAITTSPGPLGSFGGQQSSLQAQNLPGNLVNLGVTMDLTNNGSSPVVVAVVSPVGLTVPNLPNLFSIQPGEHFVGTFDGNSPNPVDSAPRPLAPGTYAPEQSFATPLSYIDGTNPNGTWGLVFFGDTSKINLKSWSLTFTTTEPTATTAADGSYSFQGLTAGTYDVRVALSGADSQTAPAGGAAQTVTAADGKDVTGVNFGVKAAPDLTLTAFHVITPATAWGQSVTIGYTIANNGDGPAGAFDTNVYLSPDGVISQSGPLVGTIHTDHLDPHSSTTGSLTVTLPATAPPGFTTPGAAYIGTIVDPASTIPESDTTNQSNQGSGIDLARVDGSTGAGTNVKIAGGSTTQQDPSLAVDPTNPNHLVSAYLNYPASGSYAGLSVATSIDGGANWSTQSIPLPANFAQGAAAPTVVFDASGAIHIAFMAATFLGAKPTLTNPDSSQRLDGFTANNGVFVVSSNDNGNTWGTPVAVASNLYDGINKVPFETFPSLAVDTSKTLADGVTPNPNFGSLYMAWSRFYPAGQFPGKPTSTSGSDVMLATSRDGGLTWTTQTQMDPSTHLIRSVILDPRYKDNGTGDAGKGFITFPTVSVGSGGDVYVSTYAGGNFVVYHSSNGGVSFTPPDYDAQTGLVFPTLNGIIVPSPTLQTNANLGLPGARTLPLRPIVADPAHPGRLYAVAAEAVTAQVGPQKGQQIDPGDILFAVSDDFGQTWTSNFTIKGETPPTLTPAQIASYAPTLNDDNGGVPAGLVQDITTQVLAGQVIPGIAVDGNGDVVVAWYDTRTGALAPNNPNAVLTNSLSVWGTVSTDGGQTFSPNFQISDTSFDTINERYRSGNGSTTTYLGDQIGLAISNGTAYVAWSDARGGLATRADVYLGKFPLTPAPAAPTDRFAPNNTIDKATDLTASGFYAVSAPVDIPKLVLTPGRADEWFVLTAGANGPLTATVTGDRAGDLHLEITDQNGVAIPATVTDVTDATGTVVGKKVVVQASFGNNYFVHAFGTNDSSLQFNLALQNLTGDLGPVVQGSTAGNLAFGEDVYRLSAAVTGTLNLSLNGDGNQFMIVLTPDGVSPLFDGTQPTATSQSTTLNVTQGDTFLILVVGDSNTYTLNYSNPDQYASTGTSTLFLPTNGDPASLLAADFTGNGRTDLFATTTDRADVATEFLSNGDGTFEAPRQFTVGPGLHGALTADNRQPVAGDFNSDGVPDVVVPNFRSADVSVLLGNGDGTFAPQRRDDAVTSPDFTAVGDFNGDGKQDLVVLQNFPQLGSASQLAVLLGHGDGTFAPPVLYPTSFTNGAGPVIVGDFTGDGKQDLLVFSKNTPLAELFKGNGDGTFTDMGTFATPENAFTVQAVDLNGDGKLDLIFGGTNSGNVYTELGNGDGTFQPPVKYTAMVAGPGDNVGVQGVALIPYDPVNSPLPLVDPTTYGPGLNYGSKAIVATAQSRTGQGPGEVILLPELVDAHNNFAGFGNATVLATVKRAGNIAVGNFAGDGQTDVAVADSGGITIVYGISGNPPKLPANTTPATARNLSTVTHYVTPALSITSAQTDAYYKFTVPTEAVPHSGPEVIDVSALFQYQTGAGLRVEVLDSNGNVLGVGPRMQVVAPQGAELTVHVYGAGTGAARGAGAYTLDIDVLPQVVGVAAPPVLPNGAATSIVITLQGDRLDPTTAEDPANYTVTYLAPDGTKQVIPVTGLAGAQPIVYDPGANVNVSSGLTFPTSVRQTITLLFAEPLPVGSYQIAIGAGVQTASFDPNEPSLLTNTAAFGGHSLVSVSGALQTITVGASLVVPGLVLPNGASSLAQLDSGTPFMTQLQNDLGSLLDALLRARGDDPSLTPAIQAQIVERMLPGVDTSSSLLVVWLDPVSINLADSEGARTVYNENSPTVSRGLSDTFVEVGGNVELMVVAGARGTFTLNVGDVGAQARGGAVVINQGAADSIALTDAMRGGTTQFDFRITSPADAGSTTGSGAATAGGPDGSGTGVTGTFGPATVAAVAANSSVFLVVSAAVNASDAGSFTFAIPLTLLVGPQTTSTQSAAATAAAINSILSGQTGTQLAQQIQALLNRSFGRAVYDLGQAISELTDDLSTVVQQAFQQLFGGMGGMGGKKGFHLPDGADPFKHAAAVLVGPAPVVPAAPAAAPVAPVPVGVGPVPGPAPVPARAQAGAGAEQVGAAGDQSTGDDVRQSGAGLGVATAAALAALLGIHMIERSSPAERPRVRGVREEELPRADQP
jgi:hypothetical protein